MSLGPHCTKSPLPQHCLDYSPHSDATDLAEPVPPSYMCKGSHLRTRSLFTAHLSGRKGWYLSFYSNSFFKIKFNVLKKDNVYCLYWNLLYFKELSFHFSYKLLALRGGSSHIGWLDNSLFYLWNLSHPPCGPPKDKSLPFISPAYPNNNIFFWAINATNSCQLLTSVN